MHDSTVLCMCLLAGMLKLVLSKGGREELRIALHCFKDQLTAAVNRYGGASTHSKSAANTLQGPDSVCVCCDCPHKLKSQQAAQLATTAVPAVKL